MKDSGKVKSSSSKDQESLRRRIAELKAAEAIRRKADKDLLESEEKYRSLVENVNIGIYRNTGGPHGRFLQANPAIARMFGYDSVEEFMKVPVSDFYQNPEERKLFIDEAMRNGFLKDKEIRLKKKDGTLIVGSCTSKVQYDEDGGIKWIDGVIEDITERKQAEERIERSGYYEHVISLVLQIALEAVSLEEQLNRILDLILSIPFLSLQAKGSIYLIEDDPGVLVIKAHRGFDAKALCDCSRIPFGSDLCGRAAMTCEVVFSGSVRDHPAGLPDHGQCCVPIVSGDHVYGVLNLILKEGHRRDEQEEKFLTSIANTLAGIIEHKKTEMEKDALQSRVIQSEKLSALGRMAANVAHEIRNPLTVLGGLARRLGIKMPEGTKEREYAELIYSETNRLEKILRSVLSFTREESIHKENFNVNEIIHESLRVMDALYKDRPITIEKSFIETVKIPVDRERVREVIDSLILNALEAIRDGGWIEVSTGRETVKGVSYITVMVADSGKGIAKEELSIIFEPFYTTKAVGKGNGIGLGLPICKKIMDEHGGFIEVESMVGIGSTFTLFFPENN